MAGRPKAGSEKSEVPPDNADGVRNTVRFLAREAAGGNKQAVATLTAWLAAYPETRGLVRALDDLAVKVEQAWVERLCGTDELARRALADEVAAMRAELLGPAPSVTDKILAATVVVSHLGFQRAALAAAAPADGPAVRAARERVLALAQKRLQDAVRGWELHAAAKARGRRPPAGLKLFEPGPAA